MNQPLIVNVGLIVQEMLLEHDGDASTAAQCCRLAARTSDPIMALAYTTAARRLETTTLH